MSVLTTQHGDDRHGRRRRGRGPVGCCFNTKKSSGLCRSLRTRGVVLVVRDVLVASGLQSIHRRRAECLWKLSLTLKKLRRENRHVRGGDPIRRAPAGLRVHPRLKLHNARGYESKERKKIIIIK